MVHNESRLAKDIENSDIRSPDHAMAGPKACVHCGEPCREDTVLVDGHALCCQGCRFVYELLNQNELCQYYEIESAPGITPQHADGTDRFAYLDDDSVRDKLIDFDNGHTCNATFHIPQMHCSSCIWLLERLYKIHPGFAQSKVNFLKRQLTVTFLKDKISLRQVVELLARLGYEPHITLDSVDKKADSPHQRSLYVKIGVAGFCFGNIMLFSFPEYLSIGRELEPVFRRFFGHINLLLTLPVILYSGNDYFKSAWAGLRERVVNLDVPISIGILTLFGRSAYEVLTGIGAGYSDSLAGLVFFLLLGKLFQQKTYDAMSFERDYKSYFPLSVTRKTREGEVSIPLSKLELGDRLVVRHGELIPADAVLMSAECKIDYSFVTGESDPVAHENGSLIYAGGRVVGQSIEVEVVKAVSQSYLTRLWNHDVFQKNKESRITTLVNGISKYFTFIVLAIAAVAGLYWLPRDTALAINAITAVLIIACPCALALSTPFTLGTTLRFLGRNRLYLKNIAAIEQLARTDTIIFDKTGTLTHTGSARLTYHGEPLTAQEKSWLKSLVRQSTHPYSVRIYDGMPDVRVQKVTDFREETGKGIQATFNGVAVQIGSYNWLTNHGKTRFDAPDRPAATGQVYVKIGDQIKGHFDVGNQFRTGLADVIHNLRQHFDLALLSGDNDRDKPALVGIFEDETTLHFNQTPHDKLDFIENRQKQGQTVLMIGDGLNDAGALQQSDIGISISEDIASFSPACDGILDARSFRRLPDFLALTRRSIGIIRASFVISFLYNVIGLSFAVQGTLSPVIAAILMPLSSITVVLFTTLATTHLTRRLNLYTSVQEV